MVSMFPLVWERGRRDGDFHGKTVTFVSIFQYLEGEQGFPGGAVVKNPPANAGDTGSSPGPGRSHMQWSN